jgi:hypothetical protein
MKHKKYSYDTKPEMLSVIKSKSKNEFEQATTIIFALGYYSICALMNRASCICVPFGCQIDSHLGQTAMLNTFKAFIYFLLSLGAQKEPSGSSLLSAARLLYGFSASATLNVHNKIWP